MSSKKIRWLLIFLAGRALYLTAPWIGIFLLAYTVGGWASLFLPAAGLAWFMAIRPIDTRWHAYTVCKAVGRDSGIK